MRRPRYRASVLISSLLPAAVVGCRLAAPAPIADPRTGERVVGHHEDRIAAWSVSDSAGLVAARAVDGVVRVWRLEDGKPVSTFPTLAPAKRASFGQPVGGTRASGASWDTPVVFDPRGRLLAIPEHDGRVRVWEVRSGRLLRVFEHTPVGTLRIDARGDSTIYPTVTPAVAVAFGPRPTELTSVDLDGSVKIWSLRSGRALDSLFVRDSTGRSIHVSAAAFTRDGRTLAVSSYGGGSGLQMYDLEQRRFAGAWPAALGPASRLIFDHVGARLVVVRMLGYTGDSIYVLSRRNGLIERRIGGLAATSAAFTPSGDTLLLVRHWRQVEVWPLSAPAPTAELPFDVGHTQALELTDGGRTLVALSPRDSSIRRWSLPALLAELRSRKPHRPLYRAGVWSGCYYLGWAQPELLFVPWGRASGVRPWSVVFEGWPVSDSLRRVGFDVMTDGKEAMTPGDTTRPKPAWVRLQGLVEADSVVGQSQPRRTLIVTRMLATRRPAPNECDP